MRWRGEGFHLSTGFSFCLPVLQASSREESPEPKLGTQHVLNKQRVWLLLDMDKYWFPFL